MYDNLWTLLAFTIQIYHHTIITKDSLRVLYTQPPTLWKTKHYTSGWYEFVLAITNDVLDLIELKTRWFYQALSRGSIIYDSLYRLNPSLCYLTPNLDRFSWVRTISTVTTSLLLSCFTNFAINQYTLIYRYQP